MASEWTNAIICRPQLTSPSIDTTSPLPPPRSHAHLLRRHSVACHRPPSGPVGLPDFSTKSRQQRVKRNPNFESTKCSTTAATHSRRSPEMRPPPTVARAPRATANSSPIGAMPPNMATASGSPSATPANATSPVIAGRALQLWYLLRLSDSRWKGWGAWCPPTLNCGVAEVDK